MAAGKFYSSHANEFLGKPESAFTGNDYNVYDTVARIGAASGPTSSAFVVGKGNIQVYLINGRDLINSGIGPYLNPALANQYVFSVYDSAVNQLIAAFKVDTTFDAIFQAERTLSDALNAPSAIANFDAGSSSAPTCIGG